MDRNAGSRGQDGETLFIDPLEDRRMLSVSLPFVGPLPAGQTFSSAASSAYHAPLGGGAGPVIEREELSPKNVKTILARAASQARNGQVIVVVDREGFIQGIFTVGEVPRLLTVIKAIQRARTGAYFQSLGEAFSTRSARFIVQDRFPNDVPNTPGGPLYGVEFSSLINSDILLRAQTPAISGDPGGVPLYINGRPAGGIGVAGDGDDVCVREDLVGEELVCPPFENPEGKFYVSDEENDFDEAVALAGQRGYEPPEEIVATNIFLDGLRLPYTKDEPASGRPNRSFFDLVSSGRGELISFPFLGKNTAAIEPARPETHPTTSFAGIAGHIMNPIVASNDPQAVKLTAEDVNQIIFHATRKALNTRAGIRIPLGSPVKVHIAVVDRDGDVVGVFRMEDGTRFSYDVAVQKARTAAFFSDNTHAFSTRAVGFMSQGIYPPGIQDGPPGPLFRLQNSLSLVSTNLKKPLANGITIFPGGAPIYKDGQLVGAIGISGDGVDQDDIIAFAGTRYFRPNLSQRIRSDQLSSDEVVRHIRRKVVQMNDLFNIPETLFDEIIRRLRTTGVGDVRLPYVKFPRNPRL